MYTVVKDTLHADVPDAKDSNLTSKDVFAALGYKPKIVGKQITRAMFTCQKALKYQPKSQSNHIPLVLTLLPIS